MKPDEYILVGHTRGQPTGITAGPGIAQLVDRPILFGTQQIDQQGWTVFSSIDIGSAVAISHDARFITATNADRRRTGSLDAASAAPRREMLEKMSNTAPGQSAPSSERWSNGRTQGVLYRLLRALKGTVDIGLGWSVIEGG